MKFSQYYVLREGFRDSVWLRGVAKGYEMGLHGSIWGTLDKSEAEDYANQFGKGGQRGGSIQKFKLKPEAKVLEIPGDKLALIGALYRWTPQQLQALTPPQQQRGDHRDLIQQMGGTPGPTWDLTQMDTLLTQKLKTSGYDAAIMGGEWKGQIVVVNPMAIQTQ